MSRTKELHLFDSNFKDEYCSLISVANRLKKIDSRYDDKLFVSELSNNCGMSNENDNEENKKKMRKDCHVQLDRTCVL